MSVGAQWLELYRLLQELDRFLELPEICDHGGEANLRFCRGRVQLKGAPIFGLRPFGIAIDTYEDLSQSGMRFGRVGIFGYRALRRSSSLAVGLGHILTSCVSQGPPAFRQSRVSQRVVWIAPDRRFVELDRFPQIRGVIELLVEAALQIGRVGVDVLVGRARPGFFRVHRGARL